MLVPGGLDLRSGRFSTSSRERDRPARAAISLHVYAGPLREYLAYDEVRRRCGPVDRLSTTK